jgi:hypothetical protein
MWAWSFEQDDDIEAGYFLATYYGLSPRSDQPYETLARLHTLVPDDKDIEHDLELARSINREALAPHPHVRDFILDDDDSWDEHSDSLDGARIGLHLGIGPGIRDMPLSFALGMGVAKRAARRLSIDVRVDWTRRVGDHGSANAIGVSFGSAVHVFTTPQVAFLVGAAQRVEVRFGSELMQTGWGRVDGGGDFTTALVLRDAPFVVGTRVEALYSGRVNALLELGFEWR